MIEISELLDQNGEIDGDKFKRLVKNGKELRKIAREFPTYADRLIERIFADANEFKRLVASNFQLIETATEFPTHADRLIAHVLADANEFQRLVPSHRDLLRTAKVIPTHADRLINRVLADANEFQRLVDGNYELIEVAKRFSTHAERLIVHVFADDSLFKHMATDHYGFVGVAKQFPEYANRLIERILADSELKNFMTNNFPLAGLTEQFPKYADQLAEAYSDNRIIPAFTRIKIIADQLLSQNQIDDAALDEMLKEFNYWIRTLPADLTNNPNRLSQKMVIELATIATKLASAMKDSNALEEPVPTKPKDRLALWLFHYYADRVTKYDPAIEKYRYSMVALPATQAECIDQALSYIKYISPDNEHYLEVGMTAAGLRGYSKWPRRLVAVAANSAAANVDDDNPVHAPPAANSVLADGKISYQEFEAAIKEYFIDRGQPHPVDTLLNNHMQEYWQRFWKEYQAELQKELVVFLNNYCRDKPDDDRVKIRYKICSTGTVEASELYDIITEFEIPIDDNLRSVLERPKTMVADFLKYLETIQAKPETTQTLHSEQPQGFTMWKKVDERMKASKEQTGVDATSKPKSSS